MNKQDKYWYIAVSKNESAWLPLFGPCYTREEAETFSRKVKSCAEKLDPWSHFYQWATVSLAPREDVPVQAHQALMFAVLQNLPREEVPIQFVTDWQEARATV